MFKIKYLVKYITEKLGTKYYGLWSIENKDWTRDKYGLIMTWLSVPDAQDYAIKNGLK